MRKYDKYIDRTKCFLRNLKRIRRKLIFVANNNLKKSRSQKVQTKNQFQSVENSKSEADQHTFEAREFTVYCYRILEQAKVKSWTISPSGFFYYLKNNAQNSLNQLSAIHMELHTMRCCISKKDQVVSYTTRYDTTFTTCH